jgi:hypothetical protein
MTKSERKGGPFSLSLSLFLSLSLSLRLSLSLFLSLSLSLSFSLPLSLFLSLSLSLSLSLYLSLSLCLSISPSLVASFRSGAMIVTSLQGQGGREGKMRVYTDARGWKQVQDDCPPLQMDVLYRLLFSEKDHFARRQKKTRKRLWVSKVDNGGKKRP